ncbi:hypothetical protein [Halorubrum sp. T3]|uniref:hypothetical protein n=1 Tax=Halorubrum sp. T3 TaxID=1194088 RepID=UPI0012BAC555|nr:hypothetical protein [Halorubrum sp. T3]
MSEEEMEERSDDDPESSSDTNQIDPRDDQGPYPEFEKRDFDTRRERAWAFISDNKNDLGKAIVDWFGHIAQTGLGAFAGFYLAASEDSRVVLEPMAFVIIFLFALAVLLIYIGRSLYDS